MKGSLNLADTGEGERGRKDWERPVRFEVDGGAGDVDKERH